MDGHGAPRRPGAVGDATNELESVLTAVVTAADGLGDGLVNDPWMVQRDLGALEDALLRALGIVQRLSAIVRVEGTDRPLRGPLLPGAVRETGFERLNRDPRWDT
jgi:hypothetical protein